MKKLGSIIIFVLDMIATVLVGILFGITFVAVQVASWTGSKS